MSKVITALLAALTLLPAAAWANTEAGPALDLTGHWVGLTAIALFVAAYAFVMLEEFTHLRKSKPVILVAGVIWALIALVYAQHGLPHAAEAAVRGNLLEYAELMLFLLVAMTYINALEERLAFDALRVWLVNRGYSFRQLFWLTGILAFFISPIADNMTTALLMAAVVMAVGGSNAKFVTLSMINIVVAANAGGAYSPFGDITTLMVWQKGVIRFEEFFALFIPSVVNFVVPAAIMHFALPNDRPAAVQESMVLKRGARRIVLLFLLTIITAVGFHNFLHLPPVLGMLTGLAYLQFFGYYLKQTHNGGADEGDVGSFEVFSNIARAEWDTLLFFYGVVMAVGGLGFLGYLTLASEVIYTQLGPTTANVLIGLLSSIVDNIPVMFAVLTMNPEMSHGQWLLVTMTAGVGGSLLSIGSAAGVALMGQARGVYTFFNHLKWSWAVGLGYGLSILTHLWLNAAKM